MRRTQLNLRQYDSDKTDYLDRYDPVFELWLNQKINFLELGVAKGGSLLMWRDYFPLGKITGIDISLPKNFQPTDRIHVFEGSQADTEFLSRVANEVASEGFDIIVDDASHLGEETKVSFWHLFENHLKPGGIFAIEDWGTGYWDSWPDGKNINQQYYESGFKRHPLLSKVARVLNWKLTFPSHDYGMVGLIKQLVDEQAALDVTKKSPQDKSRRSSKFESIIITPAIVFVKKASR